MLAQALKINILNPFALFMLPRGTLSYKYAQTIYIWHAIILLPQSVQTGPKWQYFLSSHPTTHPTTRGVHNIFWLVTKLTWPWIGCKSFSFGSSSMFTMSIVCCICNVCVSMFCNYHCNYWLCLLQSYCFGWQCLTTLMSLRDWLCFLA